ncbi:hypothetical protein C7999DRAFT_14472 [Corynascus novoguineensis]|uniref:chitinase n=1 Tax=Corynascus novoguineensis TaxID=1126955 RepID=A0AAN7CSH8_9PEZI|nr:hypothetical protein C7999DRAFT_14472 [Corynascus novoguineensis]
MGTLWRLSFVSLALMPASLASLFWSNYENCPQACNVVGQEPRNWTHYHTISDLDWCKEPMLFDLGLHTPVNQPDTHITIRACTVTGSGPARIHSSDTTTWESPAPSLKHNSVDVRLVWGRPADIDGQDVVRATENLIRYLKTEASCAASKIMFAQSGKTAVGLYVGSQIERASAAAIVQDSFVARVKANQVPSRIGAQICGDQPFSAQTFGIYADLRGNISAIQDIVRDWSTGKCLSQYDQEEVQKGKSVGIISALMDAPSRDSRGDDERKRELQHRATCKYTQADPGDGCWALAQKCEISQDDLIKYNGGKSNFCNTIISGQYVCCGTGSLPDFSPQPNPDGSCASYTAQASDTCAVIAAANQISDYKKPEEYNKNTWGWTGCNKGLQPGQLICLSKGDPPMPNPLSGATCGPQVPGRERPTNGTKLADLNPCPLNVCCNIWGNCGLSDEFCIESPADSGAPGAAKPGSNGCISNCGMDIVHSDKKPDQFRRVGYFESWNIKDRECLHMDVSKIPEVAPVGESGYTHIHFAFPDITSELTVDVSKYQDQFDGFKKLSSVKKIVSFGGWEFSNTAESYAVFRIMVSSEANRQKAARNVIRFLKDHNLDGLDFDWEYPGATDIPGTPAGSHDEGENYLKFLKTVRNSLPEGKTLSIAAPSSFWYLKNFPIKAMSEVLDYIIFMTYDLHGQWDVENKWTSPGCPTGNCLRHHVNETEVNLALALITKAGVPSHKVVVGMPFYGRSFKMAQEGCTGPDCFFLGDKMNSQPAKGECTDTAGYISNVEISAIRNSNSDPDLYGSRMIEEIEDKVGDILVYDDTEWVSWMTPKTYLVRSVEYSVGNFGGTSDWAIDLNNDFADGGKGEDYRDIDAGEDSGCDFSRTFKDLEDLNNNADGLRLYCRQVYALQVLDKMMDDLYNEYKRVDNGYDSKFDAYTRYIDRITPYAITNFMIKGLECNSDERNQGSFDMTLTLRDREGFFTALLNETGIIEEWINFDGHRRDIGYCTVEGAGVCPPDTGVRDWFGLPQKNDEIEVADPRDIVTEGLGNLEEIQTILRSTMFEIMLGIWDGSIDDVVQVMSVPVFMLAEAVEGMKEAKQLGEEQEKWEEEEARRKAKDLILTIVGAVLFVVPFVGEVGAMLAGATTLARIALIAGETANLAFGIYGMVDDPDSALMGVLGMMFGLGGVTRVGRTPKGFKDMAAKRAGLRTDGGVSKIGGNFQKRDDMLQDIVNFCRT